MPRFLTFAAAAAFTLGGGSLLIGAAGGSAARSSHGPLDDEGPFPGLIGGTPLTARSAPFGSSSLGVRCGRGMSN
jgi:hypothetical protein